MRRIALVCALVLLWAWPASAAVVCSAATSTVTTSSGATVTLSLTIGAASNNRAVYAAFRRSDYNWSATFNGSAMTELYDNHPGNFLYMAVYRIIDSELPGAGTYNIVGTASSSSSGMVGAAVYCTGVDQGTPNDAIDVVGATAATITNDITSATGDLVIDFAASGSDGSAWTEGAGQTSLSEAVNGEEFQGIGTSYESGASTVTMSWTIDTSRAYVTAGLNLNAAAGSSCVPTMTLLGVSVC